MSAICAAILALAATSGDVADSSATDSVAATATQKAASALNNEPVFAPRKPAEMRTAVSNALRAMATAKEPAARDSAIRQLILILLELEQDQNLTHDERVELHSQVRSRLMTLEQTLRAEAVRDKKATAQQAQPQSNQKAAPTVVLAAQMPAQAVNSASDQQQQAQENLQVLAQLVGGVAGVNVQRGGVIPGAFAAGVGGGIGGAAAGSGNAQQLAPDYGPDLVTLIQTVVAPRTWDVNGGPGSVVYYRNLRALVVRAPADVHQQLGDVLGQMRK